MVDRLRAQALTPENAGEPGPGRDAPVAIARPVGNRALARLLTEPGGRSDAFVAGPQLSNRATAGLLSGQGAQRAAAPGRGGGELDPAIAARIDGARGGGAPLPEEVRVPLEQSTGTGLAGVRVHTDADAALLARSLDAQAFTVGSDIFFGAGAYAPGSAAGRELIAHEVVHVAQQAPRVQASRRVSDPSDAAEVEASRLAPGLADAMGDMSSAPRSAVVTGGRPAVVSRAPQQDPPELPITGDANFMLLDQERHFPIDLPDLDDFGIGQGELSTGAIEIAEGVEARLDVGAHNPPRIADASVHVSPVQANVAATLIAERRKEREAAGMAWAATGGIVGGLAGIAAGPVGWVSGFNPISGAEKGGVLGGKLGEWGMDRFSLEASLVSGALSGRVRLLYSPYIRLRLGLTLLSKLFDVNATLQTQMGLTVIPSLALAGSKVGLHFENGKLARSEFALELTAGIEAALDVAGMLQLGATVLHIIDNDAAPGEKQQAHDNPGLFTMNILATDVFPILEDFRGGFKATAKLDLLKASPLDLVKKHFTATEGAVRSMVAGGVKDHLKPAVEKSRAGRKGKGGGGGGGGPGEGGPRYHTGTYHDPVPIIWFKPTDAYPDELFHHGGDNVQKFPHRTYADGLEAGVDAEFWPWTGKKFKKGAGKRAGGGVTVGQAELEEDFREHGVELPGGVAQIDHVLDDFLGGPDLPENLWPLLTKHNRDAGLKHGHQGVRWQPEGRNVTAPTAMYNVDAGVWFIISQQLQPGDPIPEGGAPEFLG